jgi:hypothetical protein
LYSRDNYPRWGSEVLPGMLACLTGTFGGGGGAGGGVGGGVVSPASAMVLRRLATTFFTNLTKAWLGGGASGASPPGTAAGAGAVVAHPPEVTSQFTAVLLQQVVPAALQSICNGSCGPNITSDANSMNWIGDVGVLMWTLSSVAHQDFVSYLGTLLTSWQWPERAVGALISLLDGSNQQNASIIFKDSFKQFIRELLS